MSHYKSLMFPSRREGASRRYIICTDVASSLFIRESTTVRYAVAFKRSNDVVECYVEFVKYMRRGSVERLFTTISCIACINTSRAEVIRSISCADVYFEVGRPVKRDCNSHKLVRSIEDFM